MSQVNDDDVQAIKDWLAKQSHLPKNFDDYILKKFLFSCHCSLEQTKKCIDSFCTYRANLPEVYSNRDPISTKVKDAYSITRVASYPAGINEILIHELVEVSDIFDFYEVLKSFALTGDQWIRRPVDKLPDAHIVILDIKQYTLALVARVNVFYFQKFVNFLLESMPVRLKQVHIVNCPSYYEYLYNLVKGALPQDLKNMLKFHPDVEGVYQHLDKKYLPKEYGGEAQSMDEQHQDWLKKVQDSRDLYTNDSIWRANLGAKTKTCEKNITMNGSFKTLAID